MSLFSTLDTGYTGLDVSQLQMGTTGHNIANANTQGYSRQRVITQAQTPLHTVPGDIGRGVKVKAIKRIHDEFVFGRLRESAKSLEYNQFSKSTLEEIARYFPDTSGVGLQNDMKNYFNSWNSFASNPTSSSKKTVLAQATETFTNNIQDTRSRLRASQNSLNDQLKVSLDEVNNIGKKIADLNAQISNVESIKYNNANDLRDQRDKLELSLSKLLGISVFKGNMQSDISVNPQLNDGGKEYYLNIAGESFVDGSTFHPLVIDNNGNKSKYYSIYQESSDGSRVNMSSKIQGGKIGAILDLRGRDIDSKTAFPTDGKLQKYIDSLDTLANGLIQKTNSVYASSAVSSMDSSTLNLSNSTALINSGYNFKQGSFNLVMYDNSGKKLAEKSIVINDTTTMNDIVTQINAITDDNQDNSTLDDIHDYFKASYLNGQLSIQKINTKPSNYKISIEDNGTNFAGVTGINSFLDGNNAKDIKLKEAFQNDPTSINAYQSPADGNNDVANAMIQVQYQKIGFVYPDNVQVNDTLNGFYGNLTAGIAVDAQNSTRNVSTSQAIFNAVNNEQQSISGVSIDQELTNLLKYQTAYSANAKIISTIDKMLNTLLSIKQ